MVEMGTVRFLRSAIKILFLVSISLFGYTYFQSLGKIMNNMDHISRYKRLNHSQRGRDNGCWFRQLSSQKGDDDVDGLINISDNFQTKEESVLQVCPDMSIRNHTHSDEEDLKSLRCKARVLSEKDCRDSKRVYGTVPSYRTCSPKKTAIFGEICKFTDNSYRTSNDSRLQLVCDPSICKGSDILIASIHPDFGFIPHISQWNIAKSKTALDELLRGEIVQAMKNGFDFCLLTCHPNKRVVKQVLLFPPLVKIPEENKDDSFYNVNIIALDSVSRPHFYRQLPNTVQKFKDINNNDSLGTTVLDFEIFQSLAPRTFPNMRALMSGEVNKDSRDEDSTYQIDKLFGKFKHDGFQTLLQEDSCWFDPWGALITDNLHDLRPLKTADDFMVRWKDLEKKLLSFPVDSYGLTHLSCEVFLQYGVTNQFNEPPKVCYNGKLFPTYFLEYLQSLYKTYSLNQDSNNLFTYTHLNTGHETSGKRISYIDDDLATFVDLISQNQNTLTIILSDHGPKTTKYARSYLSGRYEIAHAFMFMIIPKKVRNKLENKMNNLEINQRRLMHPVDLHQMLMSLFDDEPEGLLDELSTERNCADVPMYSFTPCLCQGFSEHLPDFHDSVYWLAESALGYLNNRILKEFYEGNLSRRIGGYGNCERLIGKRFDKIRVRRGGNSSTYVFDLVIDRYRNEEVFEVAMEENYTGPSTNGRAKMSKWRRVSIFQHYRKCSDPGVEPDLCICRAESTGIVNPARDMARVLSTAFFGVHTRSRFIDSRCLILLIRTKPGSHKTFELSNMCIDRKYYVYFNIDIEDKTLEEVNFSDMLPVNVTVIPWSIHFITSVSLRTNHFANQARIREVIDFVTLPFSS